MTAMNDAQTFSPIVGSGLKTITGISGGKGALAQPYSKILISGLSSNSVAIDGQYQIVAGLNVTRLNADGFLDTRFDGDAGTTVSIACSQSKESRLRSATTSERPKRRLRAAREVHFGEKCLTRHASKEVGKAVS